MPVLIPYTLSFRSGPHLGTRGVNLEEAGAHIPSDTLFGALVHTWRRSGGNVDAFTGPFTAAPPDPPFLLTSAFPFAGDVRFYPMPADLTRLFGPDTLQRYGKTAKRIRYLSEGLLRKALGGIKLDDELFPADEADAPKTGVALQGGTLWLLRDEAGGLPAPMRREPGKLRALRYLTVYTTRIVPRVTIDRLTSGSTIFHAGRVAFAEGCGLWFGVSWRKPDAHLSQDGPTFQVAFDTALGMLRDEGIGGERGIGYGAFELGSGLPVTLPDAAPGQPAWLLSRYHPRSDELPTALTAHGAAYALTAVAGWLHSPENAAQRRKRLFLLAEGSAVCPPDYPAGDVRDVRPEYNGTFGLPHPVCRYGLALAAGWS